MLPVGPLMVEHRLIERMILLIKAEAKRLSFDKKLDLVFIDRAVDFIRAYADKCHHGKEEDILFRELAKKNMSAADKQTMGELVQEHVYGRRTTGELVEARDRVLRGHREAMDDIVRLMEALAEFYPKHIEKEDKHFFLPVMTYLDPAEQKAMLAEFEDFDKRLVHEKYRIMVEEMEERKNAERGEL